MADGALGDTQVGTQEVDLHNVPNLPGFKMRTRKQNHGRSQTWGYVASVRMELAEGLSHDKPKFVRAPKAKDEWKQGSLPESTSREFFKAPFPKDFDELPAWDALDRHVLRFYGYFREAVTESNMENNRLRRTIIFYYLEDDTMHITEPRIDNAGIPQGTLVRRHRFPAAEGGYIKPEMLRVGEELVIYGRHLQIIDCDEFTRAYFQSLGINQPDAEPIPRDTFGQARLDASSAESALPRSYEKLYREMMLGGGHINQNQQQFMENDRKVCRFFGTLDDLLTAQYECRPFTILYFLANDTVEIREQYPLNCGRDNFPIFFRRGKIVRGDSQAQGPTDPVVPQDKYVKIEDFYVGARMNLLNRDFFIYDADEFTRQYFAHALGNPLREKIDVRLPEREVPRPPTPDYTGYGSWDDSMASVLNLIPKVPRKDFHKLMYNDGKVLRFTARFANPKPEDEQRRFVLSFYLFDDTFAIHEPPQRNMGIITGKFLEKGVHLNQKTGRLFEPRDFLPGNNVQVLNHEFTILEMDEYTRKLLTDEPIPYPSVDLVAILCKLRESLRQQFPMVRDIFRRFDRDHNGVITVEEMKEALQKFSFSLTEDEVMCIMQHFDTKQDGQISYNEFCDALLDEDYTTVMIDKGAPLRTTQDADYKSRAKSKTLQRGEVEKIRRAAREVTDVFYKHAGLTTKLMKEFSAMTHQKTVTVEMIHAALLRLGISFDKLDIERTVMFIMPGVDTNRVPYQEFLQAITAVYHDLCAVR